MKLLITGGAGFIGSALVRMALARGHEVINVDALTYASCLDNLAAAAGNPRYFFEQGDIRDRARMDGILDHYRPDGIIHLAAESHVDRSIDGPEAFLQTNILGTYHLLEAARQYVRRHSPGFFRFHHVSTDEVFGSLGPTGLFTETTPYDPRSPYSASKAASDHLVRAWGETYGLDVVISNCSNNYGPYHFPEKLIPLAIITALAGREIGVYGTGDNIRDWLFVDDHAEALLLIFARGKTGRSYNIGGGNERRNIEVVRAICALLDQKRPRPRPYGELIRFVTDRPGHDARYAIDATRLETELGWRARTGFEEGLAKTVDWYLTHEAWWRNIQARGEVGQRLGLSHGAR